VERHSPQKYTRGVGASRFLATTRLALCDDAVVHRVAVISMPVDFCRSRVVKNSEKCLSRNVYHCDSAKIRLVGCW